MKQLHTGTDPFFVLLRTENRKASLFSLGRQTLQPDSYTYPVAAAFQRHHINGNLSNTMISSHDPTKDPRAKGMYNGNIWIQMDTYAP